jgi:molybdopterin converting factor small subunit
MKIDVLLFARAGEIAQSDRVAVEVAESATVQDVADALFGTIPGLRDAGLPLLWSVNNDFATLDTVICQSDVLACFPPVSGG